MGKYRYIVWAYDTIVGVVIYALGGGRGGISQKEMRLTKLCAWEHLFYSM